LEILKGAFMNLGDLAKKINGVVEGDSSVDITGVSSIENAGPGDIIFAKEKKIISKLKQSKASAVLVNSKEEIAMNQVISSTPELAFARLLEHFYPQPRPKPEIHSSVVLGTNVALGKRVTLAPFVCIGNNVRIDDDVVVYSGTVIGDNCELGKRTTIHSNVTIYSNSIIGCHVTLHAGVVIGSDGFGYAIDEKGIHVKINQIGNVIIEDNVEIGANSCIDRATMGTTLIKRGTKIDNLVQVAHNCTIGENCILVAQVGIAGSCKLGHHVVLAGQAGLSDHVTVGDNVTLAAKSAALRDIKDNSVYGGIPALPLNLWKRSVTTFPKLPDLARRIRDLESRLNDIEKKNNS
jgi:UDP-3-O-[3-hydroxymyristoyl] glucosamine N-acyltransferase